MYGWNEQPNKATAKYLIGGEKPASVYEIGAYAVTVYGDEREVTYTHQSQHSSDPRHVLPNMEVQDGEIRIPVSDLVGEVLKRLEPADLAKALWTDDSVREEFMDCLVTRYSERGIGDDERRKFLDGVKEAVHSTQLDALARSMSSLEYSISRNAHHYDEVSRINDRLRNLDVRVQRTVWVDGKDAGSESVVLQFDARDHSANDENGRLVRGELEVGGKSWEESREYWRKEVSRQFPISDAASLQQAEPR